MCLSLLLGKKVFYLLPSDLYSNVTFLVRPSLLFLTTLNKILTYDCLPIPILAPFTGFFSLYHLPLTCVHMCVLGMCIHVTYMHTHTILVHVYIFLT